MKSTATNQDCLNERIRQQNAVKDFYENATADYLHWSKDYNMHFGYYKNWSNPFNRAQMLEQMNEIVLQKLTINKDSEETLVDLGCGMGATMRYITNKRKKLNAIGYTISNWQVKEGNHFLETKASERCNIRLGDITKTPSEVNKTAFALAIESICHTPGIDKMSAIEQLSLRLKKGGRFVIADAFTLKKNNHLSRIGKYVHNKMCKSWELPALANINEICKTLKKHGFGQLKIENISWRVAPSVIHVPFTISWFLIKNMMKGKSLDQHSINNLKGSFASFLSCLCMDEIAYCIISGEKIR